MKKLLIAAFFALTLLSAYSQNDASWLAGSWGVTFPIYGGARLDTEISNGFDYVAGAQEIIDSIPGAGHVITNLSNFANSSEFTMRLNDEIGDVGTLINEECVPSLEGEQVYFQALQTLKDGGKKVILYISISYFSRASDEAQADWLDFYTNNYGGDQYAAYKALIKGYISRVAPYADGYWLDTGSGIHNSGDMPDFIAMVKATDPGAAVTANIGKNYFKNTSGESIYIDTDGFDDTDSTDYKVVQHVPLNAYQDFTHGHVTPIGNGAPTNSWGYDEFTLPDMIAQPWTDYNGAPCLKHGWFPIRERWHVASYDLMYDLDQAYRFVKSVTDAGASITFANTTASASLGEAGHMMPDEMEIMKEISKRLAMSTPPNYVPYLRPEGAFLVGETLSDSYQAIDFPEFEDKIVGDAAFSPGAMATSGLAVSYTTSDSSVAIVIKDQIHIVSYGTVAITASQAGNDDYDPARSQTKVLTVLDESSVGGNIALSGTATQSSEHPDADNNGQAFRAIDGDINGAWGKGSVTRTSAEIDPWWQVDLGEEKIIGDIMVYGRTDVCCSERLLDFSVIVLNESGDTTYNERFIGHNTSSVLPVNTGGIIGEVVKIQKYSVVEEVLNIGEIEVYGIPNTLTFQITDEEDNSLPYASLSINGRFYTSDMFGEISINLDRGEYPYTLSKTGYEAVDQSVNFANDTTVALQMTALELYTVSFQLSNDTLALSGASLTIGDDNYTSNDLGEVSMQFYAGDYDYEISLLNYVSISDSLVIIKDTLIELQMDKQMYELTFDVADHQTNAGLSEVSISINDTVYDADAQGHLTLSLEVGTYNYTISKDDYYDGTGEVTLSNDTSVTILLEASSASVDYLKSKQVELYPNPVKETLYIKHQEVLPSTYQIISVTGQYQSSGSLSLGSCTIQVGNLNQGMYLLIVTNAEHILNIPFMKK